MLEALKETVWRANRDLVEHKLVQLTWGNVSGIDRHTELVVIKPSGVLYDTMQPDDMVVVDLDGEIHEGVLKPSSDTPTHLALYRAFENIAGIAHTHSEYATIFAQAACEIPCFGTTHADYFNGAVPVTRFLSEAEVSANYEENTGKVIIDTFFDRNPAEMPAVLVAGHGPFTWGNSPEAAVENNFVLEIVAKMALGTRQLNPNATALPAYLLNKHFSRKHGPEAYYGQR